MVSVFDLYELKLIATFFCRCFFLPNTYFNNFFIKTELRTQIMSASLLSDMESFKAANPNGKLEDFIRWYSPRDWIENNDGNNDGKSHAFIL